VLLATAAGVATIGQFLLLRRDRGPKEYDWVYMAAGGLIGGFTGQAWYATGPTLDGLAVVPMLVGAIVGAAIVEGVYRLFLRRRRT
jgi:hypothetical protein